MPALLSDKPLVETNPDPPRGTGGGRDFVHLLANAGAWPLPGPVRAVSLRPGQRCCSCSLRQEDARLTTTRGQSLLPRSCNFFFLIFFLKERKSPRTIFNSSFEELVSLLQLEAETKSPLIFP